MGKDFVLYVVAPILVVAAYWYGFSLGRIGEHRKWKGLIDAVLANQDRTLNSILNIEMKTNGLQQISKRDSESTPVS